MYDKQTNKQTYNPTYVVKKVQYYNHRRKTYLSSIEEGERGDQQHRTFKHIFLETRFFIRTENLDYLHSKLLVC